MGHRRFATSARDWHREREVDLKAVHNLRQTWASRHDGPAAPVVLRAVERIRRASMLSKVTGWMSGGSPCKIEVVTAG